MAFAEFDGVRALRQMQAANDEISGDFLKRTQALQRIRAAIYLSGTYVRDFLLEPDQRKSEPDRAAVLSARASMDDSLRNYRTLLQEDERAPFDALLRERGDYWLLIAPVLEWNPQQRQKAGYAFLRDEVFSRRTSMLSIADQIGAIATARLSSDELRAAAAYRQYRGRLTVTIGLTIGLGLLLAAFSIRQIFALEKETAA